MIILKTTNELNAMNEAGQISAKALHSVDGLLEPMMSTKDINHIIETEIKALGAKPSFLGYNGFPAAACISLNNQVIHGIPSKSTLIREGDVVSIDVGAFYNGFHGDNAYTFPVGNISDDAKRLLEVTQECLEKAISLCVVGNRIGDISNAVEIHARKATFGVVKEYVGHGVGRALHEDPEVPNYGSKGKGLRLMAGMTIAIEPMINLIGDEIYVAEDGWTVFTKSGSISAHFEHTVAITSTGAKVLTRVNV